MQSHPFTASMIRKIGVGSLIFLAVFIHCGLLLFYECASLSVAFADSVVSVGLWSGAAYMSWYIVEYTKVWSARFVIAVGIQILWTSLLFPSFA
ncbi:MAG: hypothetical protein LUG51_16435 [Tannerellaceae bacterium]|nr:hypothetical protein [Tannerellaceae bacterium]